MTSRKPFVDPFVASRALDKQAFALAGERGISFSDAYLKVLDGMAIKPSTPSGTYRMIPIPMPPPYIEGFGSQPKPNVRLCVECHCESPRHNSKCSRFVAGKIEGLRC